MRWVRGDLAWLAVLLFALPVLAAQRDDAAAVLPGEGSIQVAFAPWDDVERLLIEAVAGARREILVQAFLLTSRTFASSLIDAKARGINVQVLADGRQHVETPGSLLDLLQQHGIPVWLETRYRNAHNKIVVIDVDDPGGTSIAKPVVISGSFNFTWSAQRFNAENLIVIRDHPSLAARFARNWRRHRQQAIRLQPSSLDDREH